jgi:hypothetical protein
MSLMEMVHGQEIPSHALSATLAKQAESYDAIIAQNHALPALVETLVCLMDSYLLYPIP